MAKKKTLIEGPQPVATTAEAIIKLIDKQKPRYEGKVKVWEGDYDLWRLKEYIPEDVGYQAYTSPRPRNDFDKIFDALIKSRLVFQVRGYENKAEEAKKKGKNPEDSATAMEQLIYGSMASADKKVTRRGEPPIKNAQSFFACLRGFINASHIQYKGKDGKYHFDTRYYDPLHTKSKSGPEGLIWVSFEYPITKGEAKILYPNIVDDVSEEDAGEPTTIIDFFDSVNHCQILKHGKKFIKKPTAHGVGHVPCWVGAVGSMPTIYRAAFESTLEDRGDSWCSRSRHIYPELNWLLSNEKDKVEKGNKAPLVWYLSEGHDPPDGDPYQIGTPIRLDKDEKVEPLPLPETSKSTDLLYGRIVKDETESSVPGPEGYGTTNVELSGSALHILREERSSNYGPFASAVKEFYQWLAEETVYQFKEKGMATPLSGYIGAEDEVVYFSQTIDREDIDLDLQIEVVFEPKLPRDEMNETNMAQILTTPDAFGERLLPLGYTRENILNVSNKSLIEKQLKTEEEERDPYNKLILQLEPMIEEGQYELALGKCMVVEQPLGEVVAKALGLVAKVKEVNPNSELLPPEEPPAATTPNQPMPQNPPGGALPPEVAQLPPELQQAIAQGMPIEEAMEIMRMAVQGA